MHPGHALKQINEGSHRNKAHQSEDDSHVQGRI